MIGKYPKISVENIQHVGLDIFSQIEANDIFFVDTLYVSKTGNDLNNILFNILPQLKSGEWIHFHDFIIHLNIRSI